MKLSCHLVEARSRVVIRAALAAALACVASTGIAADEADSGGTFSTPGYPARTSPSGNPAPGATPGAGTSQLPGNPNGRGTNFPNNGNNRGNAPNGRSNENGSEMQPRQRDIEPPKPGEFQRFVEAATGRLLPIFGSRFFADAADNYQSLDNVPVSADYTLGPGDEIITRAWGSIDVDYRSTVDRNGMLNLPKVGSFNVAGVKASDLERNLRAQIGRLYTLSLIHI